MRKDSGMDSLRAQGSSEMLASMMTPKRIVCTAVIVCLLAGLCVIGAMPGAVKPAKAQFGEVILAIQITLGAMKLVGDLFSLAKYFLGPNPSAEALELLEDQMEELEAIIDQEAAIQQDIQLITDKLTQNALLQTANDGITHINERYAELQQMASLGYGNVTPAMMANFADRVMKPINSIERCVEAFYQALVVHPPGSPNCALEQERDIGLDMLAGATADSDFSTTVESTNGVNIVAERPMYFDFEGAWDGGSCQAGIPGPAPRYYFAEGTVRPYFRSFLCIQNPSSTSSSVKITYMKGDGSTEVQELRVPARSRSTVNVHDFLGVIDGPGGDFSALVETTNGVNIVAERPMFFIYNGHWTGGHVNAGMTKPLVKQYFAEGTTRPGFDSFMSLQNPSETPADVLITYLRGDGTNNQQRLTVPPMTRSTVRVSDVLGQVDSDACDFSAVVESMNGVGLIAERPVYFNYEGKWNGGHVQNGTEQPEAKQFFAEGTTRPGFDSFLSLQNPGDSDSNLLIRYMRGDGSNKDQALTIPPRTRRTVRVSDVLGQVDSDASDFSAFIGVESGPGILAERPTYFQNRSGWSGGHDEAAISSAGSKFYFAEGTRRPNFQTYICIQNPGDRAAEVRLTFNKGNGLQQVENLTVAPRSRKTIGCGETVEAPSLQYVYQQTMETLFANCYVQQLMGSQSIVFARDSNPTKYGTSDEYRNKYYARYMKDEVDMFLACTEQLVMSQVDTSKTDKSQAGIFNLPAGGKEVLASADSLAQIALGEGASEKNADGTYTKANLGLNGRIIASSDILPAGGTPVALRARLKGTSNVTAAGKTQYVNLPWLNDKKELWKYDCWTGAAPYNTLTLDDEWSLVRYRFDNLPDGTYEILDPGNNVLTEATVSTQQETNPTSPADTYELTFGSFGPILQTRGGPAILLNSSQWSAPAPSKSGALRNMSDPSYYHSTQDTANLNTGLWMYSNGGSHATTFNMEQTNTLTRTITAGEDLDIYPHYALTPTRCKTDTGGASQGFAQGNLTILPCHYIAAASFELSITDVTGGNTKTVIASDSIKAQDELTKYDDEDHLGYTSRSDVSDGYYVPYHMVSGHNYKFTLQIYARNYTEIHDNSNMWAKVNQAIVLNGLRLLGY